MKNENILVKIFPFLLLMFSIVLLSYVIYRSEFVHEGYKLSYYFKYYIIAFLFLFLSIISFYMSKKIKTNMFLILTSIGLTLYMIEIGLIIYESVAIQISKNNKIEKLDKDIELYEKTTGKKYDLRSVKQVLKDESKDHPDAVLSLIPADYLNDNKSDLFPIMSLSNRRTILCNEGGYTAIIDSDRYGFNNPDDEWDKDKIKYLLIGDSAVQGYCVNRPDEIGGNLRKFIEKNEGVLSLGFAGNGPLLELGILREYSPLINVKNIIWVYSEGNDLHDLLREQKNDILKKYLTDDNFSQNIVYRKSEIQKILGKKFSRNELSRKKIKRSKIISFIILTKTRKIFLKKLIEDKVTDDTIEQLTQVLKSADNFAKRNNAKFYFVYLVDTYRYINKKNLDDLYKYKKVIKAVKDLKIPIIDTNKEVFVNQSDPLSLFPFRQHNHLNELGNKLVADIIVKNVK